MKTTLEKILELLEHGDVFLVSENGKNWLRLVHENHRCYIKTENEPEREMNMSEDMIIQIMLYGEMATHEEYLSCKLNGAAGENIP